MKTKPQLKETATKAADRFMNSSVRAYLNAHPCVKSFDDLMKSIATEAKKALDANPDKYLTEEQIKTIKGDK
jgi:hypothetical protein